MKYALYARKSTEGEERQVLSIEAQIAELTEFASKENLEIAASFQEAKTAKEPGRTKFAEMIQLILKGEIQGILAWHPDRLARNSIDGGQLIYLLDTGKLLDLKFPTSWFENTPQGKFMLSIAFGQSKYYVDNLSENIKRGNRQKLRKGLWPSFAPIGYVNNRKTRGIDPDPIKAPLLRKAFTEYAKGNVTLRHIALFLEEQNLASYKGTSLTISSVQRILQYPMYYGAIRFNGEMYEGEQKPIISKAVFDKVQKVMSIRGKKKRKRQHEYRFTGFMVCGSCGCAITAEKQKGHVYYRCTKKKTPCSEKYLREELLINQIEKTIDNMTLRKDWIPLMIAELDKEEQNAITTTAPQIQHYESEIKLIELKLDRLLTLQLEGDLNIEEYRPEKNKLVNQKIGLEQKLTEIRKTGNNWLELFRKFLLDCSQAKKTLEEKDYEGYVSFFKNTGSNGMLKGKIFAAHAPDPWASGAETATFSDWRRGRDSNPR